MGFLWFGKGRSKGQRRTAIPRVPVAETPRQAYFESNINRFIREVEQRLLAFRNLLRQLEQLDKDYLAANGMPATKVIIKITEAIREIDELGQARFQYITVVVRYLFQMQGALSQLGVPSPAKNAEVETLQSVRDVLGSHRSFFYELEYNQLSPAQASAQLREKLIPSLNLTLELLQLLVGQLEQVRTRANEKLGKHKLPEKYFEMEIDLAITLTERVIQELRVPLKLLMTFIKAKSITEAEGVKLLTQAKNSMVAISNSNEVNNAYKIAEYLLKIEQEFGLKETKWRHSEYGLRGSMGQLHDHLLEHQSRIEQTIAYLKGNKADFARLKAETREHAVYLAKSILALHRMAAGLRKVKAEASKYYG